MSSTRILRPARILMVAALAAALLLGLGATSASALAMLEPEGAPYDPSAPATPKNLGKLAGRTTVYGRLGAPGEIDVYAFTAAKDGDLPVSLATPAWSSLADFRVAALVVPKTLIRDRPASTLPTLISRSIEVIDPNLPKRERFYDSLSSTAYYVGGSTQVRVSAGDSLAVIVFTTSDKEGAYALTIGGREGGALAPLSAPGIAARLKFGAYGGSGPEGGVVLGCVSQVLVVVAAVVALIWWLKRRNPTRSNGGPPTDTEPKAP